MTNTPRIVLKQLLLLGSFMAAVSSSCTPVGPPLAPKRSPTPRPTITLTPTATPTPTPTSTPWPAEDSTPEQQGMDSELLAAMFDTIERQALDVHGLLVVRNGHTVVEAYWPPYRARTRHGTASIGKSFTGALVGIAIREGYLEGVEQKVAEFFPDHPDWQSDPLKQAMTIEHLLTMTSGLDWPESAVSYSSEQNILRQMMHSEDWVRFVLDTPMAAAPGATFNYSSGASHLLSAILQESTGMRTIAFARQALFEPLGISGVSWTADPQGIAFGAGGLRLTPREMAILGQLYLQGGVWSGKQIVPAEWVEASIAPQVNAHGAASYYGYQWWVRGSGIFAAHGFRGQRIFVVPDLEMVVVFTADLPGSEPSMLLSNYILPAARSSEPLPENPQGVARLEEWIREIRQSEP
jgi:CubicO group peptidase (beta-lactamase class C family)